MYTYVNNFVTVLKYQLLSHLEFSRISQVRLAIKRNYPESL